MYNRAMRFALVYLALAMNPVRTDRPKVRAVTAFIGRKLADGWGQPDSTSKAVRISTQPFPATLAVCSRTRAPAFLKKIDMVASRLEFRPNIVAPMVRDSDDATAGRAREDALDHAAQRQSGHGPLRMASTRAR